MYNRKEFLGALLKAGALCGAGGMLMLGERSALAAQIETLYFEAESMSFSSLSGNSVVSDAAANGSKALCFRAVGSASKNALNFPQVATIVNIRARSTASAKGKRPVAGVLVDGREVARFRVSTNSYAIYTAAISPEVASGSHTVELRALSSMGGASTLFVDYVRFQREDAQPPPPSGTVYFQDNFDRDADTFAGWSIYGSTVTTQSQVVRAGTHAAMCSANNANTAFQSRCDLYKPGFFFNGQERYIGFSVYFPSNIRSQFTSNGWGVMFTEPGMYNGGGYPGIAMYFNPNIGGANAFLDMRTHETNGVSTRIWSNSSVALGQWVDIVLRVYFHDTSQGWVELWVNGVKQTFNNGQQRYSHYTIPPGGGTSPGGNLTHNCYRADGIGSNVTIYQDEIKVGSTYAIVQP
jgi:hypothetical protein